MDASGYFILFREIERGREEEGDAVFLVLIMMLFREICCRSGKRYQILGNNVILLVSFFIEKLNQG